MKLYIFYYFEWHTTIIVQEYQDSTDMTIPAHTNSTENLIGINSSPQNWFHKSHVMEETNNYKT